MIYVLDKDGNFLMPTERRGMVRHMIEDGQAIVVGTHPFTIQLLFHSQTYVSKELHEKYKTEYEEIRAKAKEQWKDEMKEKRKKERTEWREKVIKWKEKRLAKQRNSKSKTKQLEKLNLLKTQVQSEGQPSEGQPSEGKE